MKENVLFKLDLLQAFFLQKPARFGVTKQMLRSDKYQSKKSIQNASTRAEKQKHKLLLISRSDAFKMIEKLQNEAFDKKIHFIETALHRAIKSCLKKEKLRITQKLQTEKDEKAIANLNSQLETINELLSSEGAQILDNNIKHKIFKIIIQTYPTHFDIKNNKFDGISKDVIKYISNMKELNPYKTNSININNILSKFYADKTVKSAIENINTLEIIWGPKKFTKDNDAELNKYDESGSESESDSEDKDEDEDYESSDDEVEKGELGDGDYEKMYDGYKDYIAASSDEEEEGGLDPNVNYNEITDEEASGDDDDDDDDDDLSEESDEKPTKKEQTKKEKKGKDAKRSIEEDDFFTSSEPASKKAKSTMKDIQLPKLATGYYSGGESDVEDDDLVDELTKPRKNRRGQRARQKIWEKKYGSGAKHVVKQQDRAKSDRERLKLEFEARQVKRDVKQKEYEEREKARAEKIQKQQEKGVHPSWEAKMKAQEAQKNAKPAGKKITFD